MEAEEFDLDPHLLNFYYEEPFYSALSRKLPKVMDTSVPGPMGVAFKDGEFSILYNPKILKDYSSVHIKGILIHEFMHLINEHLTERLQEPMSLWNIATDASINCQIPRNLLSDDGIHPGEISQDPKIAATPLAKEIASWPKFKSAEWYMEKLRQNEEASKQAASDAGQQMVMDSHEDWGSPSDGDGDDADGQLEMAKAKLKQAVKEAAEEADARGKGWGSVTATTREAIRKLISKQVDWKALLRSVLGLAVSSEKTSTRTRRNRKYGLAMPGPKKKRQLRVLIAIDQSGSVCEKSLELFFGEINNLNKTNELTTIHFDTQCDLDSLTVWKRGQAKPPHRTRYGGTCFQAPTDYANKHKKDYDIVIMLTDGEAYKPTKSLIRRAWVLCPNSRPMFETNETTIQMVWPSD